MRIEDVSINHIRRGQVVTVENHWKRITSIPVGFEDQTIQVSDPNPLRWHDKEKCPEILDPWINISPAWNRANDITFVNCYGQCVPNQKIIPWNKDRFLQATYTWIPMGFKTKRTVKFASGDEVSYYKEGADDSSS